MVRSSFCGDHHVKMSHSVWCFKHYELAFFVPLIAIRQIDGVVCNQHCKVYMYQWWWWHILALIVIAMSIKHMFSFPLYLIFFAKIFHFLLHIVVLKLIFYMYFTFSNSLAHEFGNTLYNKAFHFRKGIK